MGHRSRSRSSSRSSCSSSSSQRKLHKKHDSSSFSGLIPSAAAGLIPHFPNPTAHQGGGTSPSGRISPRPQSNIPPPSGFRISLTTESPFPPLQHTLAPPSTDLGGEPVFFGSALFPNSVHPCKIAPHLQPHCRVPYGGGEYEHSGRYDLLPFSEDMELVPTSGGRIPPGRRPIEGGYEETGQRLYHGLVMHNGVRVPGKVGEHLGGCNFCFGGGEHFAHEYLLLCWRI